MEAGQVYGAGMLEHNEQSFTRLDRCVAEHSTLFTEVDPGFDSKFLHTTIDRVPITIPGMFTLVFFSL